MPHSRTARLKRERRSCDDAAFPMSDVDRNFQLYCDATNSRYVLAKEGETWRDNLSAFDDAYAEAETRATETTALCRLQQRNRQSDFDHQRVAASRDGQVSPRGAQVGRKERLNESRGEFRDGPAGAKEWRHSPRTTPGCEAASFQEREARRALVGRRQAMRQSVIAGKFALRSERRRGLSWEFTKQRPQRPRKPAPRPPAAAAKSPVPRSEIEDLHSSLCPVVGVGGLGGWPRRPSVGIALKHLPRETGLAYALVQHLDPTRESHLSEILARSTAMPVVRSHQWAAFGTEPGLCHSPRRQHDGRGRHAPDRPP